MIHKPVPAPHQPVPATRDNPYLLAKQKVAVMDYLSATVEDDIKKKFLFLIESGIEPFFEKFDRAAL